MIVLISFLRETDSSDDVVISDVQGEIIAFYRENHIDPCKDEPILSLDKDNKKDYIVNRKDLFIKSEKTCKFIRPEVKIMLSLI